MREALIDEYPSAGRHSCYYRIDIFQKTSCQRYSSGSAISHTIEDQPKSDAPIPLPVRAS